MTSRLPVIVQAKTTQAGGPSARIDSPRGSTEPRAENLMSTRSCLAVKSGDERGVCVDRGDSGRADRTLSEKCHGTGPRLISDKATATARTAHCLRDTCKRVV